MTDFNQQRIEILQAHIALYRTELASIMGVAVSFDQQVIRAAELHFKVINLTQRTRRNRYVKARTVVAHILRDEGYSFTEIGEFLCRDSSTILRTLRFPRADFDIAAVRRLID